MEQVERPECELDATEGPQERIGAHLARRCMGWPVSPAAPASVEFSSLCSITPESHPHWPRTMQVLTAEKQIVRPSPAPTAIHTQLRAASPPVTTYWRA